MIVEQRVMIFRQRHQVDRSNYSLELEASFKPRIFFVFIRLHTFFYVLNIKTQEFVFFLFFDGNNKIMTSADLNVFLYTHISLNKNWITHLVSDSNSYNITMQC